jgi:tetratricopeptide (TPR) repeat protein
MKKEVMLSSSLRGEQMKELRDAARAGIAQAGLAVSECEPWPALTVGALDASLRIVRQADYYVLVVAGRYGTRARPTDERSFTEVEFDEATRACVKRLAFFEEPITVETIGTAEEQAEQLLKQLRFREKVKESGITPITFRTRENLKSEVARALLTSRLVDTDDFSKVAHSSDHSKNVRERFYPVHEYSLLDTSLVGRTGQLAAISKWAAGTLPVMVVEAFGGFGKSALTWWWWRELARNAEGWSKGVWFSFYELSSTTHEFFAQLHAHLVDEPIETSRGRSNEELFSETLKLCRKNRHIIVLDGFERTLPIMDGFDANAERPEEAPESAAVGRPSGQELRGVRSIRNKLLARWLTLVANESAARILITTRYFPLDLEAVGGKPRRGVTHLPLDGFSLTEAQEYWELIGLDRHDPGLERLVDGVHGHPLTLEVMAGTLRTSYSRSLADFFLRKPDFPVFGLKLVRRDGRDDVFEDALGSLEGKARNLLEMIALWPLPAPLQDLKVIMSRSETLSDFSQRQFDDTAEFVDAVLGLEDRRLISRNTNSAADMHPVMRNVVRDRTRPEARNEAHRQIVDSVSQQSRFTKAEKIEDLATEIQLTISAARTGRWGIAFDTYAFALKPELRRLNYHKIHAELLAEFFEISEDDDSATLVAWKSKLPYFKPPDHNERDEYLAEHGIKGDQRREFAARQDFAQAGGVAHEALGNYRLAAAFYHEHNRTCSEPLCRTQQETCFAQEGKFGFAANILHECLDALNLDELPAREKNRLADSLFEDCIERNLVRDARTAAARIIKVLTVFGGAAWMKDTSAEVFRSLNLILAKLARAEDKPDVAIEIARGSVESAKKEKHRADEVSAMRALAHALHDGGQYDAAADAYDSVLSLDPNQDHHGSLSDIAARAHNMIFLRQFDAADKELEAVIERSVDVAFSTHAMAIIYRADLQRALGNVAAERKSLQSALELYSRFPGTPIDCWGVRTCLARLRALGAVDHAIELRASFRQPILWPRSVLAGTDKASVNAKDEAFPLVAIWSFGSEADLESRLTDPT